VRPPHLTPALSSKERGQTFSLEEKVASASEPDEVKVKKGET